GAPGAVVTGATVLPGNLTARFTINGISTDTTLTASISAGGITDVFGNPGAAFSAGYSVDIGTTAFPTPLVAKNPLGSLSYGPVATGCIGSGDTDTFTLAVDAGQTITVLVTATGGGFQPAVQLLGPTSAVLGTTSAGVAGQKALLQTISASTAGTYQIIVSGAA